MVLVHVGYLVLPVFGSVRSRGNSSLFTVAPTRVFEKRADVIKGYWPGGASRIFQHKYGAICSAA